MTIIVCVDDRGGMTFGGKRVSRDRAVYSDIAKMFPGKPIYMAEYSRSLFASSGAPITVSDSFLDMAGQGDICFVENRSLKKYVDKIESLIIYKWNRTYPFDTTFDIDIVNTSLRLTSAEEFSGNSHEKITKEIYA